MSDEERVEAERGESGSGSETEASTASEPAEPAVAEEPAAEGLGAAETGVEEPGAEEPGAEESAATSSEPTATASWPAPPPPRRLVRSRDDRVIAGVCGGLGEYLGVDAVLIRIATAILAFAGGAGILLYVIGWIAMPEASEPSSARAAEATTGERTRGAVLLGLVFVALGVFFLLDQIWPDLFSWKYVWPVALIAVGIAVLARARR